MEPQLDHINRYVAYNVVDGAERLERVFSDLDHRDTVNAHGSFIDEADNVATDMWSSHNSIFVNQLRGIEYQLKDMGVPDLPSINGVLEEAAHLAETEEVEGLVRSERFNSHLHEATLRLRDSNEEEDLIERWAQRIDDEASYRTDAERRLMERRLAHRREMFLRRIANVGNTKRLLFSETMRQAQIAQMVYFREANFYFVRWNLSPTHPYGDICDLCAYHVWLDDRDLQEYVAVAQDHNFGGLVTTAHQNFGELIPELGEWSDGAIASGIRQSTRHSKVDTRRKRAGYLPAHPLCKCFLTPIIESRV